MRLTMGHAFWLCLDEVAIGRSKELANKHSKTSHIESNSCEDLRGACFAHSEVEIGTCFGEALKVLEPYKELSYVRHSNLCSAGVQWKEVVMVRKAMVDEGLKKKMPGCGWIEVRNKVTSFAAGTIYNRTWKSHVRYYFLEFEMRSPCFSDGCSKTHGTLQRRSFNSRTRRKALGSFSSDTPRPIGFGTCRSGKGLIHSQNSSKGSSSSGGLLRGLSFKKKGVVVVPHGETERSFLINSDPTTAPDSPVMASLRSAWKRCTSLPVTPASNLSPSVSTPISARMHGESHKTSKGAVQGVVSRSLSVPGQNIVIVRSSSFAARNENDVTNPSNEVDDEEIPEEEAVCRICLTYVKKEIHSKGVQLQSAWQDFVVLVLISTICFLLSGAIIDS
ncbi:hypothetical protein GH714_002481 [Hevea brasiliensis]|uniref:DYW domain-containing protein n=1 Tax=Hevea brasiliensis TaxID=3981 RepID=A0A6A6KFP0_HEVBR|nr:hypothetical protein GH714_002481 [Hevea brasiliensis]